MSFLSIKRIIANINADSPGILMPTGTILPFSSMTAPSGYLLCDGKSYSNSTYPNLFAVIGTAYGSASPSTFSVPDLRGMFLRGSTSALTSNTLGAVDTVNDTITITNHGYNRSGVPIIFTGAVPAPLSAGVVYWTIYINDNTLAFATSQDLATQSVPSKINLTTTTTGGTITQYLDPNASTRIRSSTLSQSGNNLGSFQGDDFESHTHTYAVVTNLTNFEFEPGPSAWTSAVTTNTGATGGAETRPSNIFVNFIIKT